MKISVLTATYNREKLLDKLYASLLINSNSCPQIELEWLIMDDGSTDNTKTVCENYMLEKLIDVKYFYQENRGKMSAINSLVQKATGDLIIECDSDDYFTNNAFESINNAFEKNENKDFYAFCFLKYDQTGKNMGNNFKKEKSKMFDLYFKEGEDGEKALVFNSQIRKQYKYELENGERFITEARMFHKMDEKYDIICVNEPIMICEYQTEGYTRNIIKQFKENPYGYFKYFKEILQKNMNGVPFSKRLYAIKHYILFATLTKQKNITKQVKGMFNKILIICLYIPGKLATKKRFMS